MTNALCTYLCSQVHRHTRSHWSCQCRSHSHRDCSCSRQCWFHSWFLSEKLLSVTLNVWKKLCLHLYLNVSGGYLWCPWGSCRCRRSLGPGRCLRSCTAGSDTRWCWSHTADQCIQGCSGSWMRPDRQCRYHSGTGQNNTHWCPSHSASQCSLAKELLWSYVLIFINLLGCISLVCYLSTIPNIPLPFWRVVKVSSL